MYFKWTNTEHFRHHLRFVFCLQILPNFPIRSLMKVLSAVSLNGAGLRRGFTKSLNRNTVEFHHRDNKILE